MGSDFMLELQRSNIIVSLLYGIACISRLMYSRSLSPVHDNIMRSDMKGQKVDQVNNSFGVDSVFRPW